MASPALIENLPTEILSQIIGNVRLTHPTASVLVPCLFVCRKWAKLTFPFLYGNIVLQCWDLKSFLEQFKVEYAPFVRFLTIIGPYEAPYEQIDDDLLPSRRDFAEQLLLLPRILVELPKLSSFSFVWPPSKSGPQIKADLVIALLEALPESCLNLELDTGPFTLTGNAPHICDFIRRILPRMCQVRLYLRSSCWSLFEEFTSDSNQKLQSVSLANMETLVVICNWTWDHSKTDDYNCRSCNDRGQSSWQSVTRALQRVVKHEGCHRKGSRLVVMGSIPFVQNYSAGRVCAAFTYTNFATKFTWATPIESLISPYKEILDPYLIRTKEGLEVVGSLQDIERLAEDVTWKPVAGGGRVPSMMLDVRQRSEVVETLAVEKLPTYDITGTFPDPREHASYLWINEKKCGMKVVCAEKREGERYFLNQAPVVETIPLGWKRRMNSWRLDTQPF